MTHSTRMEAFGRRIKLVRESRGISLEWLGREFGASSYYMLRLESGAAVVTAECLERIADVLGYTMDELWRGVPNPALAKVRDAMGIGCSLHEHFEREGRYPAATDPDREGEVRDGYL